MRHPLACLGAMVARVVPVLLALPVPSLAEEPCQTVPVREFGGAPRPVSGPPRRPEIHLQEAGRFCLADDLNQRRLLDPRNGEEMVTIGGDAVVLIGADDVSLDLGGHSISNERKLGYTLVKHYRYDPGRSHRHGFERTHLRNGRLLSPGSKGIGLRLVSSGMHGRHGLASPAEVPAGKAVASTFGTTSHLIEDLQIQAGYRAILIDGRNNVIRNNRMVVDGATAIVAQGPGIVIENNVIEVRNDLSRLSGYARKLDLATPFPIRLLQADGAIVRNNEIRLLDPAAQGPLPAAIELLQSADVLVDSNRFEGVAATVRADRGSSYREVGNRWTVCGTRAPRFMPPGEAAADRPLNLTSCR